jgi:hypothetical protein
MGVNMGTATREDGFTTIRIRRAMRTRLEALALPREAIWETIDRIVRAHAVVQLKKVKENEEV